MRNLLAVLILALSTTLATGCVDRHIPENVALALAQSEGGVIVSKAKRTLPSGYQSWYIVLCRENKLEFVEIYGPSTEPRVSRSESSIGVCGEAQEMWEAYEAALKDGHNEQAARAAMAELKKIIES